MKKVISYLITAMMVFTMVPSIAFAGTADVQQVNAETTATDQTADPASLNLYIEQQNPLYAEGDCEPIVEVVDEAPLTLDAIAPNGSEEATAVVTAEEAADIVRAKMMERQTDITVNMAVTEADLTQEAMTALTTGVFNSAMKHTGKVNEGDSLQWVWHDQSTSISVAGDVNGLVAKITYHIYYYTTAEQEAELTAAVEALKAKLSLDGKTDYEKVKAIYDYMAANIEYDYAHYGDDSYKLQFTAYAALVNKTSVCQGYATLFYRLACEYGIDARVIAGTSLNKDGKPEGHSWNIVKFGDKYYNLDATWDSTWDADKATHVFFLRGTEAFENHTRDAEFTTAEFNAAYPMSETDYVPGTADDQGGIEKPDTPDTPVDPEEPSEPDTPVVPEEPNEPEAPVIPETPEIEVTGTWTDYAADYFAGGSGTESDPYVIKTAEELALLAKKTNEQIKKYYTAHYVLDADIDLSGHDWVPIGSILGNNDGNHSGFDGSFDGKNHVISNMTLTTELGDYYHYGLFGLNLGVIKNIKLDNAVIAFESTRSGWQASNGMGSSLEIGGICGGTTSQSDIKNCEVNNIIIDVIAIMSLECGGAIASANYATVTDVSVKGTVKGETGRALWVGGNIGGISNYTHVESCDFQGFVYGSNDGNLENNDDEEQGKGYLNYVGGFCGSAGRANTNVSISNCYAIGEVYTKSVSGNQDCGGFAGAVGMIHDYANYENLYCNVKVTAVRGDEILREYDFWQGESPILQTDCENWQYKNCVTITDTDVIVRNASKELDTTDTYKLAEISVADLFESLGFENTIWHFDNDMPTLVKHNYGEWVIEKEATCIAEGKKYRVCEECGNKQETTIPEAYHNNHWIIDAEKHVWGCDCGSVMKEGAHNFNKNITEPTCTKEGFTKYTCEECGYSYEADITSVIDHDKVQHEAKAATCTEAGWEAYETCSRCDYTTYNEIAATGHSHQAVVTAPTCTAEGYTTYTCACGDTYIGEEIPALDHKWDDGVVTTEPTCTENGVMLYTCQNDTEHTKTETIEAKGHSYSDEWERDADHHWHGCTCGATKDKDAHDFKWVVDKAATEDSTGLKHQICTICDYVRNENTVIDKLDHSHIMVKIDAVEVTCEEDGNIEYYTCSKCNKLFTDEKGLNEITKVDTVIPATGHTYGNWIIDAAATCTTDGSQHKECACGDKVTEVIKALGHDKVQHEAKAATCTEKGWEAYETCSRCDYTTYKEIAATGHSHQAVVTAPTCVEEGYTTYTCACGDSYVADKVAAKGHAYGNWIVDKAATCTADGSQHKDCACGDKVTEVIKATGHSHQAVVTAPTCVAEGYTTYTCACGDTYIADKIAASGHDIIVDEAVVATCTTDGLTEGSHCSRCNHKVAQEVIPATGHAYGNWIVGTEATLLAKGEEIKVCANCDSTLTRDIPKVKSISRTAATFTYDGSKRTPVIVKDVSGNVLKAGTDYKVQYLTNCKNVGAHKLKVVLMGKYSGKETISFTINPKKTTLNKVTSPVKKQIKVTWKKQTAQVTGYQIRYSTKANMNGATTLKVTSYKTNTKTIKNLKSKKKYYVQIRTYKTVNGKVYYSAWSKAKTVTTK